MRLSNSFVDKRGRNPFTFQCIILKDPFSGHSGYGDEEDLLSLFEVDFMVDFGSSGEFERDRLSLRFPFSGVEDFEDSFFSINCLNHIS